MATIAEIWNLALGQHQAGNLPAAEESYRQILKLEPRHPDTLHNLGLLNHQTGRSELALEFIRQALALKPADATIHYNLGIVYQSLGRWEDACTCYREAQHLQPDNAEAHFKLGITFDKLGRLEDAIGCFRQAVRLRPDYADAYNNLGIIQGRLQRFDEAVVNFKEALRLRPDLPAAHTNLGTALKSLHRLDEAIVAVQEAIRLKPDLAVAHYTMGSLLNRLGRFEDAAASFRRVLELDPMDDAARFLLAVVSGIDKPRTAPRQYLTRLFDGYAGSFDHHLLTDLRYQGPQLLREAIGDLPGSRALDILDLGCGTGLSGLAFQDLASTLTGVDVSTLMLAQAQARGIYQKLILGDVLEALQPAVAEYDLILSGDMFIYLGDLAEVFPAAHRALRPGGRFVFDVEAFHEPGFTLRVSARYAHSLQYIREQAHASGFVELTWRSAPLRLHHGQDLEFYVFALQKPL